MRELGVGEPRAQKLLLRLWWFESTLAHETVMDTTRNAERPSGAA